MGVHYRDESLLVEEGEHRSLLVLAFNSAFRRMGRRRFEFSILTHSLRCSRIHCRDRLRLWYHGGIDEAHPDIPSSTELLRRYIAELSPNDVIVLGASAGGYAAVLFGHLLGADSVHAFAPSTRLTPEYVHQSPFFGSSQRQQWWLERCRLLWALPSAVPRFFDLSRVLSEYNGRTKYFVHYCTGSDKDRADAEWIRSSPGVRLFAHDCHGHAVFAHLLQRNLVYKLVQPELQDRLDEALRPSLANRTISAMDASVGTKSVGRD